MLSEPWHGHNYSERVWIHNNRFIQAVGQTIEDGIISGHSVSRMTDKLIDYVKDTAPGGIRTSAETLVRSETAHFMNQGQKMAYEEIGIKQYRFVAALSELTCDRCGSLDGSVFDTDKAVEDENFPPIHPRCRCVTIMADVNLTSRIARDPLTGENYKVDGSMTFDEWKNSLSDEQKNALKYVANSEKRGIIKVDKDVAQASQKYLNKNDMLYINSKNIKQLKGYEDIVCHGDRYSLVFKDMNGDESNVSAKEFVDILKQNPDYKGGNIRLIACEVGAGEGIVPQYIANELGVKVLAPTEVVNVFPNGDMCVANDIQDALQKNETGEWKMFVPKRK